jgi:protein-L-isoaspartate(D-aspartate) O-methyltransferase
MFDGAHSAGLTRQLHKFSRQVGFQTLKMRSFLHFQVNPRLHQRGSPGPIESHWFINELKVSALRLFKPACPLIGGRFCNIRINSITGLKVMRSKVCYLLTISTFLLLIANCTEGKGVSDLRPKGDFKTMRERMVETQIKARGVKDDRVLAAMLKVERHLFVPKDLQASAYSDQPLPIGEGQTISQPYIVALMTELLELKGDEKVLEVGTGSGYQAAILAELAKEVYTIEIVEKLALSAEKLLFELGYKNIKVKAGDGYLGWPEAAPFDAIVVTCAPDHIPKSLLEQLKEGGRMVVPVGTYTQELKKITKRAGKFGTTDVIPVIFVPMTGEGVKGNK